jgi:hypothetical protein
MWNPLVFRHAFAQEDSPMTPSSGPQTDPTTLDEFDAELEHLVAKARDENIPIEGAHNVRSPHPDDADYTIEISEIVNRYQAFG